MRWFSLVILALLSLVFGVFFGAAELSISEVMRCFTHQCSKPINELIFWQIRVPRVVIGFLVGAGLAVAGATLQNITRNGLADPYLFGVVSGAGLGASIAIVILPSFPESAWLSAISLPVAAFFGALLAVTLVQLLNISGFARRMEQMLLAGVAVSFMLSALSQFLLYLGEPAAATQVVFWLMGSLARAEAWYAWLLFPIVALSAAILLLFARHFDTLMLGDENAKTLGINTAVLRALALVICAAVTACIVAYCGGIGFVGLMIPHIVRRWLGVTSRTLTVGSVLLGGSFLVWIDVIARTVLPGQEVPIGIITSAIGSVFFMFVMHQNNRYS